ncbi:HXXEE domain-containing protein [bacterium]|nr:HXXEE domain-containing protein [bacterium]
MARFDRLSANWVYGGTLAGLVLLALTPVLAAGWGADQLCAFLCLPAYMIHQYEEHDDDRFRRFVGQITGFAEALSKADVFWINVVGVWAVMAAILWASLRLDPGWGAAAGWFLLVNALAHIGQAIALRRPNPGLWTSIVLFVPLGLATVVLSPARPVQHALAILLVVALHAAILARVAWNRRAAR